MGFWELAVLAVGLSMDAFAVSVCKGLALQRVSWKECCITGAWFGGFQALMPLLGYLLGTQFERFVTSVDHWIAFVLLGIIGGNMIREALSKDEDQLDASLACKTMLLLAVATSIDALAVGITFALLPDVDLPAAVSFIGCTTFILSAAGLKVGNLFSLKYKAKAELAGGIILILLGVLLGRFICGFLCPFGWLQELLHKIPGKKLSTKKLKPLTYLKYVILLLAVVLLPALIVNDVGMGDPYFCKYICPQGVLEGAIPLAAANESIRAALGALFTRKLIILIAVVVLSVLFFRPFCKWICPLGAFYALMNKVSLLGIQVDTSKCVSCGKCARTCQMDVDITKSPNDTECIRCGKCIRACPTEAIRFRYGFGLSGNTNPKQVNNHQNQTEES